MLTTSVLTLIENFFDDYQLELSWINNIENFFHHYDLSIQHLTEILNDPKVIPMIRGKSFEFTVQEYLSNILNQSYEVSNPRLNSQSSFHDIDVSIFNNQTNKKYSAECKLAKKGSFRHKPEPSIQVKCMRSRTLGETSAEQKAQTTGINSQILLIHNDQYIASDFDLVITSIANAFFETDERGLFIWSPSDEAALFLEALNIHNQREAFLTMYVARSHDLTANTRNKIQCSRKKCKDENCNFIPNYPRINFESKTGQPKLPWYPISQIEQLLT
jgi:hypothetical protein